MTSLRDERAAAIRRRLSDLSADVGRWLPVLLDDLETLDHLDFADRNGLSDRFAATMANMTEQQVAELRAGISDTAPHQPFPLEPAPPSAAGIMRAVEERWGDGAYEGPYARQEIIEGIREILAAIAAGDAPHPDAPSLAAQVEQAKAPAKPVRARRPRTGGAAT